jgi:hypothetical protein
VATDGDQQYAILARQNHEEYRTARRFNNMLRSQEPNSTSAGLLAPSRSCWASMVTINQDPRELTAINPASHSMPRRADVMPAPCTECNCMRRLAKGHAIAFRKCERRHGNTLKWYPYGRMKAVATCRM